jgi:hypothetical protein
VTLIKAIVGYLLGFVALSVFAYLGFSRGAQTESTWRFAFTVAGGIAILELLTLTYVITKPANRLVVAANIYLVLGGLAFALNQEQFLLLYQRLGLNAILLMFFLVGVVTTIASPAGFIGVYGNQVRVRQASYILLALVALATLVAQLYPAIHKGAAVAIVTALALLQRALRLWVSRNAAAVN